MFVDDEEQNLFLMEKIIDWEDIGFGYAALRWTDRRESRFTKKRNRMWSAWTSVWMKWTD